MKLNKDKIQPYFQASIFQVNTEFKLKTLRTEIEEQFKSSPSDKHKITKKEIITDGNPSGYHLVHEFCPSWYDKPDPTEKSQLKNIEHVLLMLFQEKDYLFIHCQCDNVIALINVAISNLLKKHSKLKIERDRKSVV